MCCVILGSVIGPTCSGKDSAGYAKHCTPCIHTSHAVKRGLNSCEDPKIAQFALEASRLIARFCLGWEALVIVSVRSFQTVQECVRDMAEAMFKTLFTPKTAVQVQLSILFNSKNRKRGS